MCLTIWYVLLAWSEINNGKNNDQEINGKEGKPQKEGARQEDESQKEERQKPSEEDQDGKDY